VSWCWLPLVAEPEVSGALAWAPVHDREGCPAGRLAAWARGRKPVRHALRMDARLVDPAGGPAWVSLVLVPREVEPLFDDTAVNAAMRAVLGGPEYAAVSTLVRDASHFAGSVTVSREPDPRRLADDPFARVYPARLLRASPGLFGSVPPPAGPAIQRYSRKPWPAAGF